MISVTLSQLTDILNGELQGADITLDAVTTDTRKLTPGCLFVALKGERFDAHEWTFSTNGVSIMGRHGIPVIGFGPGKEPEAHAPNEKTWKSHLVTCAAMYAAIPLSWLATE